MLKGIIVTILIETVLPLCAGAIFAIPCGNDTGKLYGLAKSYAFGQMLLFAIFQPFSFFCVIKNMELPFLIGTYFPFILLLAAAFWIYLIAKKRSELAKAAKKSFDKCTVFGALSFAVLIFMIVMSFFMTYPDGDDAFYVTIASDAASSEALYLKNPYTGFATTLLFRYAFAPFPIWISVISKISGLNTAAVAHSLFPWSMILLSFAVMYMISCKLSDGDSQKRGLFMFFASLLILFGDYSIYSPSNFLLARSRQGKAALVSFVIPFLMLILYSSLKDMDEKGRVSLWNLLFIFVSGFAAALCSTMGGAMTFSLTLVCAFVMAIAYKKIKYPVLMGALSLPGLSFVALYLVMR